MKKTLKMAVSGALALTIVGGIAVSASAATEGTLIMYHNIQGGPTQSSDSCEIERNSVTSSYYALCTYLYNAEPTITASYSTNKKLEFSDTGIISFKIPNAGSVIKFTSKLNTIDNSNYSRANINIGY